jgi:hypothetical protein
LYTIRAKKYRKVLLALFVFGKNNLVFAFVMQEKQRTKKVHKRLVISKKIIILSSQKQGIFYFVSYQNENYTQTTHRRIRQRFHDWQDRQS